MGGSNSTDYSNQNYDEVMLQYRKLDTFHNMQLGDGTLLVHKEDPNKYAISRKFVTNNEDQFLSYKDTIKSRKEMRHPNICQTLAYGDEQESGFCSTQYYVKMILEHSNYPIILEIEKRQQEGGKGFSEKQLYLIICETLSALNYYYQFNIQHQNIRPDTILLCNKIQSEYQQQDNSQFLQLDNQVKLQDPIIFTPQTNYNLAYINLPSAHTFNYLCPILTYSIQKSDPNPMHNQQKSDLFTLGMCILHAALLEDNNDCYDYSNGRFMEDTLFNKLNKLKLFYSQELVEIIEAMLQVNEAQRPEPSLFYTEIRQQDEYFANKTDVIYLYGQDQRSSPKQHIDIHEQHQDIHEENLVQEEQVKRKGVHNHVVEDNYISYNQNEQQNYEQQYNSRKNSYTNVRETPVMAREYEDSGSKNQFKPSTNYESQPKPDQYGDHLIKQANIGQSTRAEPIQTYEQVETYKHSANHTHYPTQTKAQVEVNAVNEVIPLNDPRNPYYSEYIKINQGSLKGSMQSPSYAQSQQYQTKIYKQTSQADVPQTVDEKVKRSTYKHLHEGDDTPKVYLNEQVKFGMTGSNVIRFDDPKNPFYNEYLATQQRKSQYQTKSNNTYMDTITEHTKHSAVHHHDINQQKLQSEIRTSNIPVTYNNVSESAFNTKRNKESFQAYNMNENNNVQYGQEVRSKFLTETQNKPQNSSISQQINVKNSNIYDFNRESNTNHSQTIENYEDGSKYEGEKQFGKRNGHGKFYYPMGGRYEGFWLDDKMDGKGRLYGPNGSLSYDGEFRQDQFDGTGTLYNEDLIENGYISDPNFKDLNKERSWSRFEGTFKNDQKNGWGILYFQNGSRFEGQFMDDKANGFGTYIYSDSQNQEVRGRWENNIFVSEF